MVPSTQLLGSSAPLMVSLALVARMLLASAPTSSAAMRGRSPAGTRRECTPWTSHDKTSLHCLFSMDLTFETEKMVPWEHIKRVPARTPRAGALTEHETANMASADELGKGRLLNHGQ